MNKKQLICMWCGIAVFVFDGLITAGWGTTAGMIDYNSTVHKMTEAELNKSILDKYPCDMNDQIRWIKEADWNAINAQLKAQIEKKAQQDVQKDKWSKVVITCLGATLAMWILGFFKKPKKKQ